MTLSRPPRGFHVVRRGRVAAYGPSDAGLLVAQRNLLVYSEEFDNALWTQFNSSVSANVTTAPNGEATGDKLVEDTSNNIHSAYQTLTWSAIGYTFSCYVKAAEHTWVALYINITGSPKAWFNLSAGTVGTVESGLSAGIEDVGDGWYRCWVSFTGIAGSGKWQAITTATGDGVASYLGDGSSGIYIWGAQLSEGSSALLYQQTTDLQTITDWSGQGNDAQRGSTSGADTNDPTRHGEWLSYVTDDYVDGGNPAISGNFTVSCVFMPSVIATAWSNIIAKKGTASQRVFWFGQHSTDGLLRFGVFLDGEAENVLDTDSAVLVNDTWIFVTVSYDGHFQRIYSNGTLIKTSVDRNTVQPAGTSSLVLGYDGAGANYFAGNIAVALAKNRALSAPEIRRTYQVNRRCFPSFSLP